MTDEERQNVLQRLRASAPITKYDAIKAADEIERLTNDLSLANDAWEKTNAEYERLAALQQPDGDPVGIDASAGLIEAAELAEYEAPFRGRQGCIVLQQFAKKLRANAADRSRK